MIAAHESNFYVLKHKRLKPAELSARAQCLEDTLKQLEVYRLKASQQKQPIIVRLINLYDEMLYSIKD